MNNTAKLISESRDGKTNLGRALDARDQNAAFNRCMVGGENCPEPAIDAHCVPETALELIMDESREVRAVHSEAPKTPIQWLNEEPLKRMNIRRFNAGRWACQPHDNDFSALDTKRLEELTDHSEFLMTYKITVYLNQRVLHAGERLATPIIDPAAETPQGLSQETEEYFKDVVHTITPNAARIAKIKWRMDKMFNDEEYDKIEYRATMWQTLPTMAAVGMRFVRGPGDRVEWYGQNSYIPVWLALLPQEHGQTIITASPRGTEEYTQGIHEGMPRNRVALVNRGNNWTRLMCRKVLTNATDMAISTERFLQMQESERRKLREFLLFRSGHLSRKRKLDLPNLLNIR